ncbi:ATPase-like protein [uncultured Caudovirales phage]|uniref:ATPase-like protein n=1 Tax=uncultured Caudovirales phage TaxID=2100421 RepID=A0A6J5N2Y8_9CAUD|nr:ATPase-like protein [uncultured Caudovirales phage]
MANPSPTILSVDKSTQRVTYRDHRGVTKTDRFSFMPKNGRTATLSFIGYKFTGRPPMHFTDSEIAEAWATSLPLYNQPTPTTESEIPVPPTPQPTPQPKPVPNTTSSGGMDDFMKQLIAQVLGDFVPEIDPAKVGTIVSELLTEPLNIMNGAVAEVADLRSAVDRLRPKVTHVTLGNNERNELEGIQHNMFAKVLSTISRGNHLYLVGPAGTGKSTIAENASQALGLGFSSKSCSSQSTEASLLGYMSATGGYVGTSFRTAYETGQVFLLDEVDNGNPNILTVLNSALSNTFMSFPDGMVSRHKNFVLVATANTFGNGATAEYVGRNALDKAFLDRFVSLNIDYDADIEQAMLDSVKGLDGNVGTHWLQVVRKARANVANYGLKVVVSPRATLAGAKLLCDKDIWTMAEVMESTILSGVKDDQKAKIMEGITLK